MLLVIVTVVLETTEKPALGAPKLHDRLSVSTRRHVPQEEGML